MENSLGNCRSKPTRGRSRKWRLPRVQVVDSSSDDQTHHDFFRIEASTNIYLRFVGIVIAILNLEGSLIGSAMLMSAQRADGSCSAGEDVRSGPRDDPPCKSRSIELVLDIENQASVHCTHPNAAPSQTSFSFVIAVGCGA